MMEKGIQEGIGDRTKSVTICHGPRVYYLGCVNLQTMTLRSRYITEELHGCKIREKQVIKQYSHQRIM